ncbi:MAG: hypothetical protein J0M01_08395 [Dechloromonas sp.]|nr:hypothetical protein [Dechloromonas sp.]MBN8555668.1 hypothetical protein [Deltaproteobacteria bacterium]
MRMSLWIGLIFVLLGTLGIFFNIYLGFGLTGITVNNTANLHLSFALSSVFFLIVGSIFLIRGSRDLLFDIQRHSLAEKTFNKNKLSALQELRQKSLSLALLGIAASVLSLITGTISQTGRFPLVHGLIGFALAGISFSALYLWIQLIRRMN